LIQGLTTLDNILILLNENHPAQKTTYLRSLPKCYLRLYRTELKIPTLVTEPVFLDLIMITTRRKNKIPTMVTEPVFLDLIMNTTRRKNKIPTMVTEPVFLDLIMITTSRKNKISVSLISSSHCSYKIKVRTQASNNYY